MMVYLTQTIYALIYRRYITVLKIQIDVRNYEKKTNVLALLLENIMSVLKIANNVLVNISLSEQIFNDETV